MTLFDIFYQHRKWWCDPSLGYDTTGEFGKVLAEMEACATEYADSLKNVGDRWKSVIERETLDLCRQNHYSWNLRDDKKKWHDTVVSDFLLIIRKALEHYLGYDFSELPDSVRKHFGIERVIIKPQQKDTAPLRPQQMELKDLLPDRLQKEDAQKYFGKAIELGLMDDKYKWLKGMQLLACFAREMSLKLHMGKGRNADNTERISWQPFEDLFGIKRGKLRLNYNDIQKTGQAPQEIYLIDKVFE